MALSLGRIDYLIGLSLSASILALWLLIIFGGYTFWSLHRIHDPLDSGPPPPIARLDRATVVGKSQGRTETFQGIPYAQPP